MDICPDHHDGEHIFIQYTPDDNRCSCGKEKAKVPSVPDALAKLGDIYRERNATYGNTYQNFGKVMKGFFPEPVTINTEEEWCRLALFFHCADKLARTASQLPGGVHEDSQNDLSVYSQMLQEYDALVKGGFLNAEVPKA